MCIKPRKKVPVVMMTVRPGKNSPICVKTPRPSVGHFDLLNKGLFGDEIFLLLKDLLHSFSVEQPIGLGSGRPHCRSFFGVEPSELYPCGIDVFGHLATQGVDFPDKMPLGQTSNSRIAGHHGDMV